MINYRPLPRNFSLSPLLILNFFSPPPHIEISWQFKHSPKEYFAHWNIPKWILTVKTFLKVRYSSKDLWKLKHFTKRYFVNFNLPFREKNTCWCDCRCYNAMLQCRPNIQIIFLSRYSPRELLQFIYSPNEYFGKLNLPFQKRNKLFVGTILIKNGTISMKVGTNAVR